MAPDNEPIARPSARAGAAAAPDDGTDRTLANESPAPPEWCANCHAALTGPFCSRCGQRNTDLGVSLRVLARDFADEYLSLDSRLFRSALSLLFRPGFLTREYLLGRRERYVRPLRLYLVSSLLFFFALSTLPRAAIELGGAAEDTSIRDLFTEDRAATGADGVETAASGDGPGDLAVEAQEQPSPAPDPRDEGGGPWRLSVEERVDRVGRMSPVELAEAIGAGLQRQLPRTMFILLPVFALILKVLYIRGRWYYAEHFVFTLHFHAFAFSVFLLLLLLPGGWWTPLIFLLSLLYLPIALYAVYRQSVWWTAAKFLLLAGVYSILLALTLAGSVLLTLLLI